MSEEKKMYQKIESILNSVCEAELNEKKGKRFLFEFHLTEEIGKLDIEELNLTERSKNCLKRSKIYTISELARVAQNSDNLRTIRNCGKGSVADIMEKLFIYQILSLKPERRMDYIKRTIELNNNSII